MTKPDPTTALRNHLAAQGVSDAALDEVMPVLVDHLNPSVEVMHGVVVGGVLMPTYSFLNPFRNDPEMPGWREMQEREDAAREAACEHVIVRMSTGWQQTTTSRKDRP